MILNSKNNNFKIKFAKGFIYENISKKYEQYLKRQPLPYKSVQDYVEASIQSVSFPSFSAEPVEQVLYEDPVKWKGGKKLVRYLDKSISITFKTYEGYLNYWIFFDLFNSFYDLDNKDEFLANIYLTFLDHYGYEFITIELKQILIKSLSEITLDYSSLTAEFKTFSVGFTFNYLDIRNKISNYEVK